MSSILSFGNYRNPTVPEDVIVEEAGVDGECAHEEDHVPAAKEHLEDLQQEEDFIFTFIIIFRDMTLRLN